MQLKLYHAPMSRAIRPHWVLEELGLPYELVSLNTKALEHKSPQYMKIHPHGAIPALLDGDFAVFESAAICMYLADKCPEKGLAPVVGTVDRGQYYQWILYAMTTMEPPIEKFFLHSRYLPEAQRSTSLAEEGRARFAEVAKVLSRVLEKRKYLLGERFSVADVMVGSLIVAARDFGLTQSYPNLEAYFDRFSARPAYKTAAAADRTQDHE